MAGQAVQVIDFLAPLHRLFREWLEQEEGCGEEREELHIVNSRR
jgi:hypothetical protein